MVEGATTTIGRTTTTIDPDNSQESREQILFCRNKLSASYPADVILQRKQMEAIRLGTTITDSYYNFAC